MTSRKIRQLSETYEQVLASWDVNLVMSLEILEGKSCMNDTSSALFNRE